ncbi:UDP-N-acetylglucosamine 4,6-dehydratase (inverting) [Phycisphaerae bacterium RAS1]|nr:UDP-N-acetylglucosamine 4,6-dehydratase (inverting) [Phycisphaerae bacterium RAS1]
MNWGNATVLITGGTGSFGRHFAAVLLAEQRPAKVIIYSRDECKQHDMRIGGFDGPSLRYFIGDVRDAERLRRAMRGVDVVVHAAALKQVPACEYNPMEAVATNITGARNVIDAALDCRVSRVLALSTDKATEPINIYGATKLVAEKLFVHANVYSGDGSTTFACVRYGNVLGSRGSVVPLFREQRKTGTLTITDGRMTRFWMTLDQGVRFVISCVERMHGGEVFIPRLPSMKLVDLARAIAPECRMNFIGIRPGEKLHESLLSEDEARMARELSDRFVMLPADPHWSRGVWEKLGPPPPEGFSYRSDNNADWLTGPQILELIEESPSPDVPAVTASVATRFVASQENAHVLQPATVGVAS